MRLAEESSSSSRAKDEVSAIAAKPINMADTATTTTTLPVSRAIGPT